ncbi:hypothetical protein [Lactiplantibacillus garii]|nr:hypothetical protein [Lactiplantibacillus garii]
MVVSGLNWLNLGILVVLTALFSLVVMALNRKIQMIDMLEP